MIGPFADGLYSGRGLASAKIEDRFRRGPWRVIPVGGIIYIVIFPI